MTSAEAIERIVANYTGELTDEVRLQIERLVLMTLDYCRREDFPEALCYLFATNLSKTAENPDVPLSRLKQDDTEFTFAVHAVDTATDLSTRLFATLRSELNLYRRLAAW